MFFHRPRFVSLACGAIAAFLALNSPAGAQETVEKEGFLAKLHPFRPFDPSKPITVTEMSRRLDCIIEEMRDDGLVILKQPDTFSQARMTRFRNDFESQMSNELANFHLVLAARINRLDAATTTSQTALSGALSAPGTTSVTPINTPPPLPTLPTSSATGNGLGLTGGPFNATSSGGLGLAANTLAANGALSLGVEPTVYLEEKKRFLDQLNEIRRISLGPDQNDSSGYGLYLVRMPISITPGEKTDHGFGADLSVTVEHEFSPQFLPTTFKNLVINDIVDQLGPAVYEVLRSGLDDKLQDFQTAQKENAFLYDKTVKKARSNYASLVMTKIRPGSPTGKPIKPNAYSVLFKENLTDFILRDATAFKFDAKKKDIRNIARMGRLDALAAYLQFYDSGFNRESETVNCGLHELADALSRIIRDAGADELFPNKPNYPLECAGAGPKKSAREIVEEILALFLDHAIESTDSDAQLDITKLIERMYDASLPDDVQILDKLFMINEEDKKTVTNPFALSNDAEIRLLLQLSSSQGLSFASTRTAKQVYPIAPRDILLFYGLDNILSISQDAKQSLRTAQPRLSDIRSYLRHTLETAYDVMSSSPTIPPTTETDYESFRYRRTPPLPPPLSDSNFLDKVFSQIQRRAYVINPSNWDVLNDYERDLLDRIDQNRLAGIGTPIGSLCWAIALDAVILDHALRDDARKIFESKGMPTDLIDDVRFYHPKEGPRSMAEGSTAMARAIFGDYVKLRWPVVTFSLDPVTDQQNIADSFNLKRDLQLAVSFAFATGQIGFNQLNTFRRQIEQSSDTIALNKTVTGFIHGNDMFGFRFSPRFQNPPNQRTNIGVITSQLIGGGPGPDYQTKKSKLEPGIRELTVVMLLPTFLPTVRMNVTSNWFRLNDPEHLVFHTSRMMEYGRRVNELRKAYLEACASHTYRGDDLRVLQSKLDHLETMLPMQSKVIQLPFDNIANGFDLLSEGSTALVPELTGYSGVDVIIPPAATTSTTPPPGSLTVTSNTSTTNLTTQISSTVSGVGSIADVFITGKYLSILDTKVVAGGKFAAYEILSREVIHVQIPQGVIPTTTNLPNPSGTNTYIEVYLATPNGISNSILIPYQAAPPTPVKPAYNLPKASQSVDVYYQWLGNPPALVATVDPTADGLAINWDDATGMGPNNLQVTFSGAVGSLGTLNFSMQGIPGTTDDYKIDKQVFVATLLDRLQGLSLSQTPPGSLPATVKFDVQVQPWIPNDGGLTRVRKDAKKLADQLTVNLYYSVRGNNALPPTVQPVPPPDPVIPKPKSPATSMRTPSTDLDHRLSRTSTDKADSELTPASQLPGLPSLSSPPASSVPPALPRSVMLPEPPPAASLPTLQVPNGAAREADQVARMLTGQPLRQDVPLSTQAAAAGVATLTGQVLPPLPQANAGAGANPSIVVMPAPVVVVAPPHTDAKKKSHKSRLHQMINRIGDRVN